MLDLKPTRPAGPTIAAADRSLRVAGPPNGTARQAGPLASTESGPGGAGPRPGYALIVQLCLLSTLFAAVSSVLVGFLCRLRNPVL